MARLRSHEGALKVARLALTAAQAAFTQEDESFCAPGGEGHRRPESPDANSIGHQLEAAEGALKEATAEGLDAELVSMLVALGAADALQSGAQPADSLARALLWLSAHTACRPLTWLDEALEGRAAELWRALLAAHAAPDGTGTKAPAIAAIGTAAAGEPMLLRGELSPAPRHWVLTTVLAATLLLFLIQLGRLVARWVLLYRRPAELRLTSRGLELRHHTELLGRVIREGETVVPTGNLARITREVRFARVGLYAGLTALAAGSYIGMGMLVDAVRVPGGSFPLAGIGVLLVVLGLMVDFAFSSLSDSVRGRCRLVVVPRRGRSVCVGGLSTQQADAVLTGLAEAEAHAELPAQS